MSETVSEENKTTPIMSDHRRDSSKVEPYGTFDGEGEEPRDDPRKGSETVHDGSYHRLSHNNPERSIKDQIVDSALKLIAEFVGVAIFIFIGTLQGLAGAGVLGAAVAHGITIAVLIMGMGHISGGHFNPAVTLGVLVSGNMAAVQAVLYIIAQLLGGFLGALLARAVVPGDIYIDVLNAGVTIPPAIKHPISAGFFEITWAQGIILEAVLTYVLVSTVLLTAVDTDLNVLAPAAIGLSIMVDILAGGNLSGASMNPARSLGPAIAGTIWDAKTPWKMHYIYWAGPAIGSVLAGVFYKMFFAKDGRRWLL